MSFLAITQLLISPLVAMGFAPNATLVQSAERIALSDFSIVAPKGEHWIESPRFPDPKSNFYEIQPRLSFVKIMPQRPESPAHTVVAQVLTASLAAEEKRIAAVSPRDTCASE